MAVNEIIQEVKKAVLGKDEIITKLLVTLLARGNVLLEDIPGVGKTNLALAFSKSMALNYHRIQFTSDVMPSDITGFTMYNPQTNTFEYKEGVAFCHLLLADEINRTSSKTQAALLEVMEEGKITVDGVTRVLPEPFFVIATQNAFGSAGTQLLPDSQLDRFMTKMTIGYPDFESELEILKSRTSGNPIDTLLQVVDAKKICEMQKEVDQVFISEEVYQYIVSLVSMTRQYEGILQGSSPRGALALMKMSKAYAYINKRDYVVPSDIKAIIHEVLDHRIILSPLLKTKEKTNYQIIEDIVNQIPTPEIQ